MEDPICPACKAVNDERAAFCDQCGQHLRPAAAPGEGDCPACGGAVETRDDGSGACRACGLELVAAPAEPCGSACGSDGVSPERLTQAILQRTRAGLEIEKAVAEACAEVLKTPAPPPPETDLAEHACPLCGARNTAAAAQCVGCGLWFEPLRAPEPCPRCERPVPVGGTCACGALLTLPALLRHVDPSVRGVCKRCKQPYAVVSKQCPDCGGEILAAESLKAYAAKLSAA